MSGCGYGWTGRVVLSVIGRLAGILHVCILSEEDGFGEAMTELVEAEAAFWKARSKDDQDFIRIVNSVVERRIKYVTTGGWEVKCPERTLKEQTGDCSEKALLKVAMLTSQGIDAHVVYGIMNGVSHDTVEVRTGKYVKFIDPSEQDAFTKLGDGLHPQEIVIE